MTIEELEQKVLSKYGEDGMAAVCFAARMLEEQSYDGFDCVDECEEDWYDEDGE